MYGHRSSLGIGHKYGHRNGLGDSKSMSKVAIEMSCMTNLSLFTMFGCRVYPLTERDTLLLDWVKVGECGVNTVLQFQVFFIFFIEYTLVLHPLL